jgi:DNA helicase-2/ATP-dependent DNA helicase PcrA
MSEHEVHTFPVPEVPESASLPPNRTLLDGLSPTQRSAVENTEGPTLVLAGAGSGKTRVLTYRVAWLLESRKAWPSQILALTFTNKAAREMKNRIEALVGHQARSLAMGTFHSVFSRILREEAQHLGFSRDFTIYDEEDAQSLIKTILKELRLDDTRYKPRAVKAAIGSAKNNSVTPRMYQAQYALDTFTKAVAQVYTVYQTRLQVANAMDFDDILNWTLELMAYHPEILKKYQERFRYILVDEYQDTNYTQYQIVQHLARAHKNLTVVGDDAQSIYSFRGATIENILSFQKDYPEARVIKLEQNYRSTDVIVRAANAVIQHNSRQLPKHVFTQNSQGDLLRLLIGSTDQEEAQRVVDSIREQKMVKRYHNKDFAILYRTNAQSRLFEDGLRRAGLPYRLVGGLSFYKRKEVKDVVAYLRLCVNPRDEEALKRIINYPTRGIGDTTLTKALTHAAQLGWALWDVLCQPDRCDLGRSGSLVVQFTHLIQSFIDYAARHDAYQTIDYVAKKSGILRELHQDNSTQGLSRYENVMELLNAAKDFIETPDRQDFSLTAFLNEIALYTDADEATEDDDRITLMTIHAAKGLEFTSVFVTGLEEGLFPSSMSLNDSQGLEEERRLFYVAVTRAEKNLTLSYAKERVRYNDRQATQPSRFIEEIDRSLIAGLDKKTSAAERPQIRREAQPTTPTRYTPLSKALAQPTRPTTATAKTPLAELSPGCWVQHDKFGRGRILTLDGTDDNARLSIEFDTVGTKTIIYRFANLTLET